jgi:hypothetical protein
MIPQYRTQSKFDLLPLFHKTVSIPNEFSEVANVLGSKPDSRNVSGACEIGEKFSICPIGLIGSLLHSGNVAGMGKFDRPVVSHEEKFGELGTAGTGFDGGVNIRAEGGDDPKDGFGIVLDGLIGKKLPLLIHDTNLNRVGVVVNANKNG